MTVRGLLSRKFYLVTTLSAVLLSASFGQNRQNAIPIDSLAYAYVEAIFLEQGLVVPNTARPWTEEEFRLELSRVKQETLSEVGKNAFKYVESLLSPVRSEPSLDGRAGVGLTLEAFIHSNLRSDAGYSAETYTWMHGYEQRKPILTLPFQLWIGDAFYAISQFEVKEEPDTVDSSLNSQGTFPLGVTDNYFNLLFDDPEPRLDLYFPFKAYVGIGGQSWSLRFGRDKLSWGNGHTGNLVLSDYSDFYDFLSLSLFGKKFKFSTVYTVFDAFNPDLSTSTYSAFLSHRLDLRLFEKVLLSINESLMFGNLPADLIRDLNFMAVYHNWTIPERANSIASIEINYNPWRFINVYSQLAVDEYATKYEIDRGGGGGPPIFGLIAGVEGVYPVGSGYLRAGLEWIETSPWLYNRRSAPYIYNVRRYWSLTTDLYEYIVKPVGYIYGPDSLVLNLHTRYDVPGGVTVTGNLTYLSQGEKGALSAWDPQPGDAAPTGENPQKSWLLSLEADYPIFSWLKVGGSINFSSSQNLAHVAGTYSDDVEISSFVSIIY